MVERKNIARAAGLMSAATLISRILGLVRDQAIAFFFGASGITDAFYVAFKFPNMLREIFAEGSMSAAVIPVLTDYEKEDRQEGRNLVRLLLGLSIFVVGGVCVLGIIFAEPIVSVIAYGFRAQGKEHLYEITVALLRVMMPFLLFVSLASVVMGALNTRRIFFIPALSPAMFNFSLIATISLLALRPDRPIMVAAVGVTIGGFMQLAFQAPRFSAEGYSLLPSFGFGHPGLRRIATLMLPVMIGTAAVTQINAVIANMLGTFLPEGSITYLFYAMRLIQFPVGIFGVAIGMAVLPSLSSHAHAGDMKSLKEDFSFSLRLLFFIGVPAMAGLMALRVPIVATLFQHGGWGAEATLGTAEAVLFYSLGLWAIMGVKVLASTFYSLKDTRTPVKAALLAVAVNISLGVTLMGPMKHSGLALAQAIAAIVNFSLLITLLRGRLGSVGGRGIAGSLLRAALASAIMGLALNHFASMALWTEAGRTLDKALLLLVVVPAGAAAYILGSALMRSEELGFMVKLFKDKFAKENG